MSKKLRFAYFALMAINGVICIVDIVIHNWWSAVLTGVTVIWLIICYQLVSIIGKLDKYLNDSYAEIKILQKEVYESHTRENIRQQEFNKMRERAQEAEKKYLALVNDTPARGKDGKFVKREE